MKVCCRGRLSLPSPCVARCALWGVSSGNAVWARGRTFPFCLRSLHWTYSISHYNFTLFRSTVGKTSPLPYCPSLGCFVIPRTGDVLWACCASVAAGLGVALGVRRASPAAGQGLQAYQCNVRVTWLKTAVLKVFKCRKHTKKSVNSASLLSKGLELFFSAQPRYD